MWRSGKSTDLDLYVVLNPGWVTIRKLFDLSEAEFSQFSCCKRRITAFLWKCLEGSEIVSGSIDAKPVCNSH